MQDSNEHQPPMIVGGNLKDALNGQYTLNLREVFQQTLLVTKKHWSSLFLGCIAFLGILIVITLLAFSIFPEAWIAQVVPTEPGQPVSQSAVIILSLLGAAIGAPFWGGLILMGIRHSVDIPTKAVDVFDGFSQLAPLVLTLVVTSVLTQLAIFLTGQIHWGVSVLAQLYLNVIFAFALPLVIERRITPLNAIYYSVRITHFKLPLYVLLLLMVTGLIILSSLMFFVPLIIVVPLIFNMLGIVYKEVVGVSITLDKPSPDDDNKPSPWDA